MSLVAPKHSITVFQGETRTLRLTVREAVEDDQTGQVSTEVRDLTNHEMTFTVKRRKDGPVKIQKKSAVGASEIEIAAPRSGVAKIKLVAADTRDLEPGTYIYDVWVTDSSGDPYPVIRPAEFRITRAVSKL